MFLEAQNRVDRDGVTMDDHEAAYRNEDVLEP